MAESSIKFGQIVVAQQTTDSQVIGWQILGIGHPMIGAVVNVYRSYVENTGYDLIATVPATSLVYRDETVNLTDRWRIPFYKLEIVDSLGNTRMSAPVRVSGEQLAPGIDLVRATITLLRLGGNPILVYQRRFDTTERCSNCWDPKLRQVTLSNCEVCYNTGYNGGYHLPVLTLAIIVPEMKVDTPGDTTRQQSSTESTMSNYPLMRPRDLIYEINTGRRFRVVAVRTAEKHRMLINQTLQLEILNPSDIEHRLAVPEISTLTPVITRARASHREMLRDNFSPSNESFKTIYI